VKEKDFGLVQMTLFQYSLSNRLRLHLNKSVALVEYELDLKEILLPSHE
ncbi:uncharacterized protein METZ01_LOCUS282933, partial [marine metagenome]